MIELRPYKAQDAEYLVFGAVDSAASTEGWKEWAVFNEQSGPAFTGLLDGKIIGSGGIRIIRPGIGNMWSVFAKDMPNYKLSMMKCLRSMLAILIEEFEFKRLRSESRIGFPESQRLLEFLGFTQGRIMLNKTHYSYFRSI